MNNQKKKIEEKTKIMRASKYRDRPIDQNVVHISTRLDDMNRVLQSAFLDFNKVLICELQLLLPRTYIKSRRSTLKSNRIYERFIKLLALEVGAIDVPEGLYNEVKYLMKCQYMPEGIPYISYNIAVLVNQGIFECPEVAVLGGSSLIELITKAWKEAAELSDEDAASVLAKGFVSSSYLSNEFESWLEDYNKAHLQLSKYAILKKDISKFDESFDSSI